MTPEETIQVYESRGIPYIKLEWPNGVLVITVEGFNKLKREQKNAILEVVKCRTTTP